MILYKDRLRACVDEKKNNLCLGIDLHLGNLPDFFNSYAKKNGLAAFALKWGESLLHLAKEHVPSVKFQSSFFEAMGPEGAVVLSALTKKASDLGLITILDVKRCDIASTMKAYGDSAFRELKADAMTVIPYMGLDVFRPLYSWMEKGRGIYSVFLSSNPEGLRKQASPLKEGGYVAYDFHRELIEEVEDKGLSKALGFVVGVSSYDLFEKSLKELKKKHPFLLPGIGFQGGSLTSSSKGLLGNDEAHLFPISRSLTALGDPSLVEELGRLTSFSEYEELVLTRLLHFKSLLTSVS